MSSKCQYKNCKDFSFDIKLFSQATVENHPAGFHTISSHVASQSLLNPLIKLLRNDDSDMLSERGYTAITTDIGVDISVPFMQTGIMVNQRENNIGMVVQRQHLDTCYSDRILLQQFPLSYGTVSIKLTSLYFHIHLSLNVCYR